RVDRSREVDVVAAVELRREARLDAHLARSEVGRLARAPHDLRDGQEVTFLLAVVAAERAEPAVLDADVREIDVAVHHERYRVARLPATELVGGDGQREQITAGRLREPLGVAHGDLAAGERAVENAAHVARGAVECRAGTTSGASAHAIASQARRCRRARRPARGASRRGTPGGR